MRSMGHKLRVSRWAGGGGGSYITYKYYCNVGVAFCKGPISRVKKVLADGKTIWNIAPDIDYTTTQITGSAQIVYVSDGSYGGGGYTAFYDVTLLSSGSGSPDLSLIKSGKILEISAPGGSGSFEVESSDANIVAGTTQASNSMQSAFTTAAICKNPIQCLKPTRGSTKPLRLGA